MKTEPNVARLDVAALAAAAGTLRGVWPLSKLRRLAESCDPATPTTAREITWSAHGERRLRAGSAAELWLHLQVKANLPLTCQRCLQATEHGFVVDRWIRFVTSEEEAAKLDAELEDDVLELPRFLDLPGLVEDELLLALPLVPMHGVCPQPLRRAQATEEEADTHPFAALESLKQPRSGH